MNDQIKIGITRFSRLISNAEGKAKDLCDVKDLTSTQLNYLETINELDNPNLTELSAVLGLKKPSVTVVIERLITKGCIYKTQSDADRRTTHIHLTEVGKQINQRHDFAHEYMSGFIAKSLSANEQQEFVRLLNKVLDSNKVK
ncbi:MAG: MarR family transcriptional regulator [Bacteroidales bacterium]